MAPAFSSAKFPSGLPAISPHKGENTRGKDLPQTSLGGAVGLSPPPCGEDWEGRFSQFEERSQMRSSAPASQQARGTTP